MSKLLVPPTISQRLDRVNTFMKKGDLLAMSNEYKSAMITVKVTPARLEEFRIAAMLRGVTMSALISQFVAQIVREEQAAVPEAFRRRPVTEVSIEEPSHKTN